jgi:hypothetical protein
MTPHPRLPSTAANNTPRHGTHEESYNPEMEPFFDLYIFTPAELQKAILLYFGMNSPIPL